MMSDKYQLKYFHEVDETINGKVLTQKQTYQKIHDGFCSGNDKHGD